MKKSQFVRLFCCESDLKNLCYQERQFEETFQRNNRFHSRKHCPSSINKSVWYLK